MATKLERLLQFVPPEWAARGDTNLNMLLSAWATAMQDVTTQLDNTKMQLFVATAEGKYLDLLASNVGVSRPGELGLLDNDFRELIPNLSFKPKQITKSFYDVMDVFWGPIFSRANISSPNAAPYAISVNDSFEVRIDGGAIQRITVRPGEIKNQGFATDAEMLHILARIQGATASMQVNASLGEATINIRTNTPGPRGSVEIISGFSALGFASGKVQILNLKQRTVIYQVNPGEIIIELPAIVPTLRRTLRGSHHWHSDATIEPAIPPDNGIWAGSFVYSKSVNPFLVTGVKATLQSAVTQGNITGQITVDDTSTFPASGELIFDFGRSNQEQPVKFLGISNSQTILIDPSHVFDFTHGVGGSVNVLAPGQSSVYAPRQDGSDLAIYLTSPSDARVIVQQILETLQAAGIVITFILLLPEYRYLRDNPYA